MNIVDALVVTLGLDASNYVKNAAVARAEQKKMTDEERQAAKDAEQFTKQRTEAYRKLAAEVLGLVAIFTAGRGAEQFAREITGADAATGRLAHNLNMSTEALGAWESAAQIAGGSASGIDAAFQGLMADFQNFQLTGESTALPLFNALGIHAADASNRLRPLGDLMLDLADKFHGMDPAQAQSFGSKFGFDPSTINMLEQGRAAVQGMLDRARQLGVPQDSDATNAQNLLRDIKEAQLAVTNLARQILNELSPTIHTILFAMDDWIAKNKEWLATKITEAVQKFADFLKSIDWKAIGAGIESFVTGAGHAVDSMNGWVGASEILFAVWAGSNFLKMMSGLGLLRLTLAGIAAELIALGARSLDSWLDTSQPWASDLDNWINEHTGLGHSYQQQREQFGSAAGGGSGPGPTTAEQKGLSKQAIDYFKSQGWTAEQAAGIVGNLQQESGFNTQSGRGTAHQGIAQWSAERQQDIEQHFRKSLMQMSYQEQLAAVQWELTDGKYKEVGNRLRQATVARQAAAIIDHGYESPGNYPWEDARRGANAEARLKEYQGTDSPAPAQPSSPSLIDRLSKWWNGQLPSGPDPQGPQTSYSLAHPSKYIPSAADRWGGASQGGAVNDNSSETHFHGPVNVNTQATDAHGIASDMRTALANSFSIQANTGLA